MELEVSLLPPLQVLAPSLHVRALQPTAVKAGLEIDMNEAIIRRIRSYKANRDAYTDVMGNSVCKIWHIKFIGMCTVASIPLLQV